MKIVVTGTRGIPNVMGGVETHCEELFPRIAAMGEDVTVIRRKSYVSDGLKEWKGVKLVDIETPKKKSFEAIIHKQGEETGSRHTAHTRHRAGSAGAIRQDAGHEGGVYASRS